MTAAEIILVLYWGVIAVMWALVVIGVVALIIRVIPAGGAWLLALIILGSVITGFAWRARRTWRRSLARPIPDRGLRGWLWRQPGWRLALLFGAFYLLATIGGVQLGILVHMRPLPGPGLVLLAACAAFLAVGQAAGWCVRRQRQTG